ncbi:hypothetical protein AUR64_17265 [Haloprofundus marisrubri]|uniref:Uncharacterized protein n=1 Tax=Haloprofundus marisrubri TaxID=1514971 RepID=A0A0W1R835_9EURY|nr:hypothetical protein [Haloprofundus marisrubri]KTG09517.1 hypothetical protein AUR64_17265 [Haloprofundus marisrubri]
MPRIQLVVRDGQKDRWEDHVADSPGIDSVSDLIRTAVEEFISTDDSSSSELNDEVVDVLMESLDEIEGDLGTIETSLDKLHRRNVEEDEMELIVEQVVRSSLQEMFEGRVVRVYEGDKKEMVPDELKDEF